MKTFLFKLLKAFCFRIESLSRVFGIRLGYRVVLERIRHKALNTKIKVLFLSNEAARWKAQSLYDLLEASPNYEPIIGLTHFDFDWDLPVDEQRKKLEAAKQFFLSRGMRVVDMYDHNKKTAIAPAAIGADVVFYQMPYAIHKEQSPRAVGNYALTCYIPYYVINFGVKSFDYGSKFHHTIWRYFILNKDYERLYSNWRDFFHYCGKLMGLGHTGLDFYYLHREDSSNKEYVIFAPHWSIPHPNNDNFCNSSTFLDTSYLMLEYAQKHRELNWVFRPHPTLRFTLMRSKAWEQAKIDAYWKAWEELGMVSEGGEAPELLLNSRALITDCGSFLTEYFVIGKPLIHLIPKAGKLTPSEMAKRYFSTFYQVHNKKELEETLALILERGEDPKKAKRDEIRKKSGLADNYAAENIMRYFDKVFKVEK